METEANTGFLSQLPTLTTGGRASSMREIELSTSETTRALMFTVVRTPKDKTLSSGLNTEEETRSGMSSTAIPSELREPMV